MSPLIHERVRKQSRFRVCFTTLLDVDALSLIHQNNISLKFFKSVFQKFLFQGRDLELVRLREEEAQRVHILQSAILNYVGSGSSRGAAPAASPR